MEKNPNCCRAGASLLTLVLLLLFPVRSDCKEDAYSSLAEAKAECCVREHAELKRFKDIDYNDFVGLVGKRRAAQPNRLVCPCVEDYFRKREFINHGRQRFPRFL